MSSFPLLFPLTFPKKDNNMENSKKIKVKIGAIMTLNAATSNTLKALFSSMDKPELDESLKLLLDESLKRDWKELWAEVIKDSEINPVTTNLEEK